MIVGITWVVGSFWGFYLSGGGFILGGAGW